MNNERYNQIIDEVYEKYITQIRIEFEKWCERNPHTLVNYREDTKELFLKSIKEDTHWFTGEKNFSDKWGLKIEERELSLDERLYLVNYDKNRFNSIDEWINWYNNEPNEFYYMGINYTKETALTDLGVPTKLITVTYKDEKTEIYE